MLSSYAIAVDGKPENIAFYLITKYTKYMIAIYMLVI